jgi:hypothetical protein
MRSTAMPAQAKVAVLPRGWIIIGMALASWLVITAMWTGMTQIFALVAAVV